MLAHRYVYIILALVIITLSDCAGPNFIATQPLPDVIYFESGDTLLTTNVHSIVKGPNEDSIIYFTMSDTMFHIIPASTVSKIRYCGVQEQCFKNGRKQKLKMNNPHDTVVDEKFYSFLPQDRPTWKRSKGFIYQDTIIYSHQVPEASFLKVYSLEAYQLYTQGNSYLSPALWCLLTGIPTFATSLGVAIAEGKYTSNATYVALACGAALMCTGTTFAVLRTHKIHQAIDAFNHAPDQTISTKLGVTGNGLTLAVEF